MVAHEALLRRIVQAGGKIISVPQLFCELQSDWARKETVPAFMNLFIETGGPLGFSSPTTAVSPPEAFEAPYAS